MVITQERNESFVTKVEMFYEDNEPSKMQYFKEGSYVFPRRGRRVPVQWCNAALQPKFALLLQSLIYFEGNSSLINQGIMQLLMDLCIYHQSRLLWRGPLACRQQNCDAIQDLNERSCPCNHSFYSTIVISPCHCSRQSFSFVSSVQLQKAPAIKNRQWGILSFLQTQYFSFATEASD